MARPRKNSFKSAKTTIAKKTAPVAETVSPVEEAVTETAEVVEEVIAESTAVLAEEVKAEAIIEEISAEEIKPEEVVIDTPAEPKPKRKYTKRVKKDEEIPAEDALAEKKVSKNTKKSAEINAFIQGAGAEKSLEELAEKAKELSGVKSPKSVNLYIKPYEDDGTAKVYYVVDNIAGHFSLF